MNFRNYRIGGDKPGKATLLDRMMEAYFRGEDAVLSVEDEVILKRWKVVHMLSMQHRPCIGKHDIARALKREFDISIVTAYKDIEQAQRLFGHVNRANKDFKRAIYIEWLEQLASLAEARGDIASSIRALEKAAELMRLGEADIEEGVKGDRVLQLNLVFMGGEKQGVKSFDLNRLNELPDTEFKELIRAVDRPRVDSEMMLEMLTEEEEKFAVTE